jgi:arylsulfatase A-like enzyme
LIRPRRPRRAAAGAAERFLRLALCAAALGAVHCRGAPAPNVLLVSVDTLRADAIGPYGGIPTPTLDRLAAEGVVFEQVFAPAPATAPSHAALFTGDLPLRQGVLRNGDALPESAHTLAEHLRARGWRTAGFASSFVLDPRFGWAQGFEHYDADFAAGSASMKRAPYPGAFWSAHRFEGFDRRAAATTQAVRAWLEHAPEPFFLFVHYFDPHAPYVPPKGYAKRVAGHAFALDGREVPGLEPARLARLVRRYHAEVLYVDDSLAALLDALAQRPSGRSTLTVVTGDHGEGLGQHGWLEHGRDLYDEQIRVPLLLHWPGQLPAGHRVRLPVSIPDVPATLAELAGVEPLPGSDGRSLAASARGGPEPESRPLLAQHHAVVPPGVPEAPVKTGLRTEQWKYVRSTRAPEQLYDLAADPGELRNLARERAEVTAALGALVDERLAALPGVRPAAPVDEETLRALRALGYTE